MNTSRALIVDDEPDIRALLEITLSRMNITTQSAEDVAQAKRLLQENHFDLCLTDMHLPDGSGIDLVTHIQNVTPALPVAVITAFGSIDTAISALKAGAFDYVTKPVHLNQLRELVTNALDLQIRTPPSISEDLTDELVGDSSLMKSLKQQIHKLARSQAPIYISGESGTGKERVARLIHELGPRSHAPFVPVNCGAIPSELMESEFFGHKKGSFTGAHEEKQGLFQAACNGTLFLDEVADLPLHMQVKLLRSLQEKRVRPVGAAKEIDVNVRILCATHKNLLQEVQSGHFRQDLYYRLNVIQIHIPPLRERKEDLPQLCSHFLHRFAQEWSLNDITISDAAMQALLDYNFPGNVRELENILERAITLSDGALIEQHHLQLHHEASPPPKTNRNTTQLAPQLITQDSITTATDDTLENSQHHLLPAGETLEQHLLNTEKKILLQALQETRWNRTAAAKRLGLSFRSLRYRLKKLGLDDEEDHE